MQPTIDALELAVNDLYGEIRDYNYRAENLMGEISTLLTQLRELAKVTEDPHK